jgi:hypothetical protein
LGWSEVPAAIREKLMPEAILDKQGKKGRKTSLRPHHGREFEEAPEGKPRQTSMITSLQSW